MKSNYLILFLFLFTIGFNTTSQTNQYLVQLYPNPFEKEINYEIIVKEGDSVKLESFDINGSPILTSNSIICVNNEEYNFNLDSLKQGIYFGRLTINEYTFTNKFIYTGSLENPSLKLKIRVIRNQEDLLKAYPNPIKNNSFTIGIESTSEEIDIEVFSIEGKLIQKKSFQNNTGAIEETINTASWQNGQYIVKMRTSNGNKEVTIVKTAQ